MRDLQTLQGVGTGVGASMVGLGTKMQDFGRSVSRVGRGLTVGVTLPIVGVGVAATKMALDFDDSLTKMVSLVGLTRGEVDGMRGDIIRMASQYGKSAGEAADAMFFITSAGLRGSDAMEALEASLKGAAVGLGDVKTIADLATSAVNAYGADTLGASKATDILAAAVREGKLESSELAGAMGQVLPVSSAMGVGFDEVGAAMAAMSRTGTGAAQASTQLRGILMGILKPTKQAEKALGDMGLSSEGLRQQLKEKGLLSTLQTLSERFDGNDAAAAAVFGNVRALAGVMDLMGANVGTTEEIFANMVDTTGMLDDAFAATAETTGFKLRKAFADMKNSLIEFGDVIAPFVAQFAERLSALGQAFQSLSPHTKEMIVRVAAIAAAVGPALLIIGKLITVIGGLIKGIGLVVIAFGAITAPVAAVVAGIALLVGAFILAWRNSEPLRNAVRELFGVLQTLGRVIVDTVLGAFRSLTGEGNTVGGILQTVGRIAGQILTPIIRTLTTIVKGVGAAFQVAGKIFEVQVTVFRMIAGVIRAVVIAAIDILMNKLGPLSRSFRSMATGLRSAFNVVAGAVVSLFNNAGKILEGFVNRAIRVVNTIIDAYNVLARALGGMQQVSRITEFRLTSMSAAQDGAAVSLNNAATATFNAASATGANIREMERAEAPTKKLGKGFEDLIPVVEGAGGATKDAGDAADKAGEKLKRFQDVFTAGLNHLKAATADVQKAYDDMATSVSQAIFGAFDFSNIDPNRIGENGEKVGGSWLDGLQSQADKAIAFSKKVAEVIKLGLEPGSPAFEAVMQVTKQQGDGLLNELIAGGVEAVDKSIAIVNSVKDAADQVGIDAADQFHGTGLTLAKQAEEGFAKRFGKDGPGYNKINRLMTALSKSLTRTAFIDVVTRYRNEGSAGTGTLAVGATGGIVNRPTFALIGEAGPEAVVPLSRTPGNEPLTLTRNAGGRKDVSTTINVTVNAGIGTDGAEVGRQIVDTIKQYERRNGPVYVAA
jgi:TP901 family phage tail tape measure protein